MGKREMQLVCEFVDMADSGAAASDSSYRCPVQRTVEDDVLLFARFLIAAMLYISEPKIKSGFFADRLGVSRTVFFSHLKNVTPIRPFVILAGLRICIAKRLLVQTERNVNEIAVDVGKENADYFSIFFKNHTGMTPMEYRRKWRSGVIDSESEKLGILEISMLDGLVCNVNVARFAERLPYRKECYLELMRGL